MEAIEYNLVCNSKYVLLLKGCSASGRFNRGSCGQTASRCSCCISHLVIEGASILRKLPELNDATLFFRWTDTSAHSWGRSWRLEEEEYDFHVFGLGSVGIHSSLNSALAGSPAMFISVPNVCKLEGLVLQSAAMHQVRSKTAGHRDGES